MERLALSQGRRTASLILKCIVMIVAFIGALITVSANGNGFTGRPKMFLLFTGMSVMLTALISAVGAVLLLGNKAVKNGWFVFKYVGTVAITVG